MKTVGLTGGIGSGKTLVASIFEQLGYLVYKADERSKHLLMNEPAVLGKVIETFGKAILGEEGKPDRKKLADLVFKKPKKLQQLNNIMHPAVLDDFKRWKAALDGSYNKTFIIKEAAILFEAGTALDCDKVIEVFAPKELRIQRVMNRDKVKHRQVVARMTHQWPESEKVLLSDYIIFNDGEHAVLPQVMAAAAWLEKELQTETATRPA